MATRDEDGREMPENIRIPLEQLYGAPERLERVAKFIVEHWEERRAAMEGKAIIVTMSRDIATRFYEADPQAPPGWHDDDDSGAMKVIMNEGCPRGDDPKRATRSSRHEVTAGEGQAEGAGANASKTQPTISGWRSWWTCG